jgi:hypothetical protein
MAPGTGFSMLEHRFAKHGRDYIVVVEDGLGSSPGQHEITFTHCTKADFETRVQDGVGPKSWTDEFTDYKSWTSADEPEGYVWGTNRSLAYPGLRAVSESAQAAEWTRRLGKEMFEVTLETDRFFLRLIFHSLRSRKISEDVQTISQMIHPLL